MATIERDFIGATKPTGHTVIPLYADKLPGRPPSGAPGSLHRVYEQLKEIARQEKEKGQGSPVKIPSKEFH
ncbi:MAG TPA: hypothetical protein PKI93_03815 [Alphaproteobacteria bacterium]|nr:hypothetical protein [Alphaproteobacteria bacterium]HNS43823.1 hypothetical protein [Alphaproteobacteria bacterium]